MSFLGIINAIKESLMWIVVVALLLAATIFVIASFFFGVSFVPQQYMVCTQEAKLCPDGSAVGRTGPNCAFARCPIMEEQNPKGQYCVEDADCVCTLKAPDACGKPGFKWKCVAAICRLVPGQYNKKNAEETQCLATGGDFYYCPPCPKDAVCSPCPPPCICPAGTFWKSKEGCAREENTDTSSWKTYRNEKFGFESLFKISWYPS